MTFTYSFTPTFSSTLTYTYTPTYSPTLTPSPTDTLAPGTHTFTPAATATFTPSYTATATYSFTPSYSFTATFTPKGTLTPSVTASCGSETVGIFDQRGEMVKTLCGLLPAMNPQNLNLTVSTFVPNASGVGGILTLSLNGKVLAFWDATDSNGKVVPNGFYHLVVTQVFTDGTSLQLQKTVYVGPLSRTAQVQLSAQPNIAYAGGTIHLLAVVDGVPVNGSHVLKLFDTNREAVKTLDMSDGQAVWDLTSAAGQEVSSGLYLIVLDTVDPATGNPARKTIKVVVLR